mgnify:CR=1 FL=1
MQGGEPVIFLVTPTTVSNPRSLIGGTPPRKILSGLTSVFPRGLMLTRIWWRLALEYPLLRYSFALSPFPVAMIIWPELALPISGAPLLMFLFINYIEGELLSVSNPDKRRRLLEPAESARRRDLFTARARALLTRIAAGRNLTEGSLHLVVEQSPMRPVAPLTVVSLQAPTEDDRRGCPVLELSAEERRWLTQELFDAFPGRGKLTEREFHRMSLRENLFLHHVELEARSISAHARMAALARAAEGTAEAGAPTAASA